MLVVHKRVDRHGLLSVAARTKVRTMKSRLAVWAVYLVGGGLISFAALEIALRLYLQAPVFTLRDWRGQQAGLLQTSGAIYDPLLGWSQRSNFVSGGFDTLDYGIRKNS